jgi:hypothetical protein
MIIHRCVREDEMFNILKEFHDEPCGGHFVDRRTTYKFLHSNCFWPTLFRDVMKYVRECDSCQRMGRPIQADEMPLQLQVLIGPFEKWALDFVGPINTPSKGQNHILVALIMLQNGWKKFFYSKQQKERSVVDFLFEDIITHFEVPRETITNQGTQFTSKLVQKITLKCLIKHKKSPP